MMGHHQLVRNDLDFQILWVENAKIARRADTDRLRKLEENSLDGLSFCRFMAIQTLRFSDCKKSSSRNVQQRIANFGNAKDNSTCNSQCVATFEDSGFWVLTIILSP